MKMLFFGTFPVALHLIPSMLRHVIWMVKYPCMFCHSKLIVFVYLSVFLTYIDTRSVCVMEWDVVKHALTTNAVITTVKRQWIHVVVNDYSAADQKKKSGWHLPYHVPQRIAIAILCICKQEPEIFTFLQHRGIVRGLLHSFKVGSVLHQCLWFTMNCLKVTVFSFL